MDSATGWWVFWLLAALALYFGLAWVLLRLGAATEDDGDTHGASGVRAAAHRPPDASPGTTETTDEGGKSQ